MSSHHIVRDQQEPAVLIHEIDVFPTVILHALLEWSPTVVCCEPSIPHYLQQGCKLDVSLISFVKIGFWQEKLQNQQPIEIISIEGEQYLKTGLDFLQSRNHTAVNIITAERNLRDVVELCVNREFPMDIVVLTEKSRYILFKGEVFKKWIPKNSSMQFIPLAEGVSVTTQGFDKNLTDASVEDEVPLSRTSEGEISITCKNPPCLIAESI